MKLLKSLAEKSYYSSAKICSDLNSWFFFFHSFINLKLQFPKDMPNVRESPGEMSSSHIISALVEGTAREKGLKLNLNLSFMASAVPEEPGR